MRTHTRAMLHSAHMALLPCAAWLMGHGTTRSEKGLAALGVCVVLGSAVPGCAVPGSVAPESAAPCVCVCVSAVPGSVVPGTAVLGRALREQTTTPWTGCVPVNAPLETGCSAAASEMIESAAMVSGARCPPSPTSTRCMTRTECGGSRGDVRCAPAPTGSWARALTIMSRA